MRVIRFQPPPILKGMTGWMLRTFCVLPRADAEVDVVLERHADQVGDRVLRLLRQRLGAAAGLLAAGVAGRERQGQEAGGRGAPRPPVGERAGGVSGGMAGWG